MKSLSSFGMPALAAALGLLLGGGAAAQSAGQKAAHPFGDSRPIPGRYIVLFKDSVADPSAEAASAVRGLGGQVHHTYTAALKGFAATLPDAALQGLRRNPHVESIE